MGDWNGDGRDDVAIGSMNGPTRVFSVLDGAQLFEVDATGALHDPGDLDCDGSRDLLVGDTVYSGATGLPILTMGGWTSFHPAQDFDLDGMLDFVAGDPAFDGGRGRAAILSGASGSILQEYAGDGVEGDRFGFEVAVADVDGDGVLEAVIGAAQTPSPPAAPGYVEVWSAACAAVAPPASYCIGAPNSAGPGARIDFEGSWSPAAADLELRASGCPPQHSGLFYYGALAIELPFGNGFRCVGGQIFRLPPVVSTGPSGTVSRALDFASPPLGS